MHLNGSPGAASWRANGLRSERHVLQSLHDRVCVRRLVHFAEQELPQGPRSFAWGLGHDTGIEDEVVTSDPDDLKRLDPRVCLVVI